MSQLDTLNQGFVDASASVSILSTDVAAYIAKGGGGTVDLTGAIQNVGALKAQVDTLDATIKAALGA